jgi:hypothetical protein
MPKVSGIVKIHGTLDDLTFYKTQDGHLVKRKGGVSASRIANDANFKRTRENNSEFGSAASAGKLLRKAVRTLMLTASDNRVTSRVTQAMSIIKNYDTTSLRGARSVSVGIANASAKLALKDFNFNMNAVLNSILHKQYTVNTTNGHIDITGLVPLNDISNPNGATHLSIKGAWAKIDFAGNTTDIEFTNSVNLAINTTSTNINLVPTAVPTGSGISFFLLAVEFFQQVNGVQYVLNNGQYNALSIVAVA